MESETSVTSVRSLTRRSWTSQAGRGFSAQSYPGCSGSFSCNLKLNRSRSEDVSAEEADLQTLTPEHEVVTEEAQILSLFSGFGNHPTSVKSIFSMTEHPVHSRVPSRSLKPSPDVFERHRFKNLSPGRDRKTLPFITVNMKNVPRCPSRHACHPSHRITKTNYIDGWCWTVSLLPAATEGQKGFLPPTPGSWDPGKCSPCRRRVASQTSTWNTNRTVRH